ncbi:MAG: tRNA (adenosine(37)-N6)-threonylcarbamoyltransferase complex dimerization subunit type 1 TsaB [Candidatus Accumulibacter sp.]|nr:tRNA (adenosine(37)-N6)-threonylcarbamoyltransferase complex dimerization subunit type 1 TsaB [Accumulibacter sp.]
MKILAFETAADPGTVALWHNGHCSVHRCPEGQPNSSSLLPLAANCLREAGFGIGDMDGIAFGEGPGSFTGLRIACGIAQGISVARNIPLLGVGTLDAMAHISGGERVIALLDARMGEIYAGFFEKGRRAEESIGVYTPETIPLLSSGGWLACGNGLAVPGVRERIASCVDVWRPNILPDAGGIACLAAARFARGERIDPSEATSLYVRDKVAKTVAERKAEEDDVWTR